MHGRGISHHITNQDTTVEECLKKHFRLEPAQVAELLRLGAIYSNKRRVLDNRKLPKGTYLRLHLQPKRFDVAGVDWKKRIVKEGRNFLVVDKPAGVPVHASLDNQEENVLEQLRRATGAPLFVTQRLDIPVSGLMVYAKNQDFQRQFNQALADHQVVKKYAALTEVAPSPGKHVHFMEPNERSPRVVGLEEKPGWQRCELSILETRPIGQPLGGQYTESTIVLYTGRTHQIRAQLSALGCPILGDRSYGSRSRYRSSLIALASICLEFQDGDGALVKCEIPPPWNETIV